MPDGSTSILVQGRERVNILQLVEEGSVPQRGGRDGLGTCA